MSAIEWVKKWNELSTVRGRRKSEYSDEERQKKSKHGEEDRRERRKKRV